MSEVMSSIESELYSDQELRFIADVLHKNGLPVPAEELRELPFDAVQRIFVEYIKEIGKDSETLGRKVFGSKWQESIRV